jgi:hypothetical protein
MNGRGTPLVDLNPIVSLIGSTHKLAGLHVRAELDRGRYPAGITVTDAQIATWLASGMVTPERRPGPPRPVGVRPTPSIGGGASRGPLHAVVRRHGYLGSWASPMRIPSGPLM